MLSAIDLKNPDKLLFQVPHGDTPDNDQEPPAAQGHEHPEDRPERQRRRDDHQDVRGLGRSAASRRSTAVRGASLRAYDKMTGAQIGEVRVPAPILGMPMTYSVNGRQYIVVGVSGGNYTGEYIAFRLPASELPRTNTRAASVSPATRNSATKGRTRKGPSLFCFDFRDRRPAEGTSGQASRRAARRGSGLRGLRFG